MSNIKGKDAYTKSELIERAKAEGLEITGRMIDDWVSLGLIAGPKRKGRGKGKGTVATWSFDQLRILLLMLGWRKNDGAEIGALCNFPVWTWLGWGEKYTSLSQVKKAMATWRTRYYAPRSVIKARRAAEEFTEILDQIEARKTDRQKLIKKLVEMQYQRKVDRQSLKDAIEEFCDSENSDVARLSVDLLEARYFALNNLESFSNEDFKQAKHYHMRSTMIHWQAFPGHLIVPEMGSPIRDSRTGDQHPSSNACLLLMTELGMLRLLKSTTKP